MILALYERPNGVETTDGNRAVYDLELDEAHFGAAKVDSSALVWELGEPAGPDAALAAPVQLDTRTKWLMRCDRVDFLPGGIAYRHTHPGPGIRYLLHGSIRIESGGERQLFGPLEPWFESGQDPVLAVSSDTEETAFVRVMLLPREWAGKRTIHYVDAADAARPKRQQATLFFDEPIDL